MYKAFIKGVGSYVPTRSLSNAALTEKISRTDEWIVSRTGISERRVAAVNEATSDLAYYAAVEALRHANLHSKDLDLILVATETPDHILPPVACQVQHRLECRNVAAMDVHNTCVGFLSALQIAEQFIKAGTHRNILVIGADTLTRLTDYDDPSTSILFGDAAGAIILSRSDDLDKKGLISTKIHSDGQYFDALYVPGGGSRFPASAEHKNKMIMDGRRIFKLAVKSMSGVLTNMLQDEQIPKDRLDWLIPHQANLRIIEAVARNTGFPMEKVINTVSNLGNSCSATIPVSLDQAVNNRRISRGDMLGFVSFGAGLVWGAALVEY
ncbi:beta-ketoacyl-ACP synthase III [Peribacillus frigoritolerans]|uniref:beta-ketoacyl-ACP synthase III n=1 Tax=Peribacillus frigoritolerans TaxID=450367 RepID=UPI0007BEAFA6|nr:beta-ketoacyl-ACP synthase III [Peribacillus frigoritolerans]